MPITSLNPTLNGSYELQHFIVQKAIVPVIAGTHIKAQFADGKLSGNGGINTYNASYKTSKDMPPSKLTVSELTSAKVGGDAAVLEQEQRYFQGLCAVTDIVFGEGTLSLTWDNGQKSLVFQRL